MVTYPSDWTESKLLDHVNLVQGLTYTPENVKPHGTLVLRSSNIQEGHLALEDNVYVDSRIPEEKMIQEGDILVCVRNGSSALIGKSCVLPAMSNTTFGAFMSVLRGDTTGYIAKVFESDIVQEQVRGRSNATINQITKKDFKSIAVTMPDGPEQKAIAGVLSSFDSYISDLSELIEKKKAIRDGALEDLVSGRKRLSGFAHEWKNSTLGKEYQVVMGQSPTSASYNDSKVGVPLVQGNADIADGVTAPQRYTSAPTKICYTGATLVSVRAPVGSVSRANQTVCLGRGVCAIDGKEQNFIFYLMRYCEKFWQALEQGSTFTAVGGKEVRAFEIRIPSEEKEQKAIADVLTSMDDEINALEDERNKMIQIREGAMDDLLTGRVRLPI